MQCVSFYSNLSQLMVVFKKEAFFSSLKVENPVTMLRNKGILRYFGIESCSAVFNEGTKTLLKTNASFLLHQIRTNKI